MCAKDVQKTSRAPHSKGVQGGTGSLKHIEFGHTTLNIQTSVLPSVHMVRYNVMLGNGTFLEHRTSDSQFLAHIPVFGAC